MTACTERPRSELHSRNLPAQAAGEGQKGMPKEGNRMTACTERHGRNLPAQVAGEGQKGMPKEGTA